MKKRPFSLPMTKLEMVVGWVYVFVHMFAMVLLLGALNVTVFPAMGFTLSTVSLNLVYYAVGFIFLLILMFHFWKESFADLTKNLWRSLAAVVVGYAAYFALAFAVNMLLMLVTEDLVNPNSAAAQGAIKLNPNTMMAVAVFMGPIVEETLFRGVVFGTIRKKSRIAAYAVSVLLFAVYHLWQEMVLAFSPSLLLYLLQYLPAGIVLAAVYEVSGSVWCPVFLHMLMNFVSVRVTVGL